MHQHMATRHEQCGCSFGIAMYNAGATLCWNNMLNVLCSDPFYFFIDINLENASAFLLFFDRKEKAEMAGYSMCCTLCTSFIRRRSTPPHPGQPEESRSCVPSLPATTSGAYVPTIDTPPR
jgi:hypothetical protein